MGHPRAAFSFVVVFPFHPRPDGAPGGEVRAPSLYLHVAASNHARRWLSESCWVIRQIRAAYLRGPDAVRPQVTLLREYSQGVNEMMYVLPTGAFDPQRHACAVAAGRAELSEEVRHQAAPQLPLSFSLVKRWLGGVKSAGFRVWGFRN